MTKKILALILAAVMVISLVSCGKKSVDNTDNESVKSSNTSGENDIDNPVETGDTNTDNDKTDSNEGSDMSTDPNINVYDEKGDGKTPTIGANSGTYSDDGSYKPAEKIDGEKVIYQGSYSANSEVSVNELPSTTTSDDKNPNSQPSADNTSPTEANPTDTTENNVGENATEPIAEPPVDDIYKKAVELLGSYEAKIDFCYYVDMSDGWHESHPANSTVTYNADDDSYTAKATVGAKEYVVSYADGVYKASDGTESTADIGIFYRQCNLVTPMELNAYNFEVTENRTVVSAYLPAADYKYKLMMSSNFFSGYEKESYEGVTMNKLYYTAEINSNGELSSTKYEFTFTVASSIGDLNMTVIINALYE